MRHTWVSGYWLELLWIWSKATTVLPCQSVLKDQSQSSLCELPKAFAVLQLEPEWAHSLVERYELKAMVHLIWVAKICYWHFWVGPQQGSSCPVSFESMRLSSFQKQRKVSFLIKKWKGVSSHSRVHALPARPRAGQLSRVLASRVGCGVLVHQLQLYCSWCSRSQTWLKYWVWPFSIWNSLKCSV